MTDDAPAFRSRTLEDIPRPDVLDVIAVPLPEGAPEDPAVWAREIFGAASPPLWVRAAMGLRQAVVPLLGIRPAPRDVFAVRDVVGEEALIAVDDRHLDFRCGVGVDPVARLVRVTTAVRLKGVRGRVYFAPVGLAHPAVVTAMLRRTARRLTRPAPRDERP